MLNHTMRREVRPSIPGASPSADLRGVLIDLDGTLIRGGRPIPGATTFVARHQSNLAIVSNNSSDTPGTLAACLKDMGFPITAEQIFLAGAIAVEQIAMLHPGAAIHLLGSDPLKDLARAKGLAVDQPAAKAVLVARDEDFTYGKLAKAANAIRRGAKFYAANADLSHPGADYWLTPETGALTLSIAAVVGRSPDMVFGKPHGLLLSRAMAYLGLRPDEAVMIGDNPATDGLGAREAGVGFIEVGDRAGRTINEIRL